MSPVRTTSPADLTAEIYRQINRPHAFLNAPDSDVPGEGPLAHAQGLSHFVHRVDALANIDREKFRHALQEVAGKSRSSELLGFSSPPASPLKAAATVTTNRAGLTKSQDNSIYTAQTQSAPPISSSGNSLDGAYLPWQASAEDLDSLRPHPSNEAIPSSYVLGDAVISSPVSDPSDPQYLVHSSYDTGTNYQGAYGVDPSIASYQTAVPFPNQVYQGLHPPYAIPSPPTASVAHHSSRRSSQAEPHYPTQIKSQANIGHKHIQHAHRRMPSPSPRKKLKHEGRNHQSLQLYPQQIPSSSPTPSSGTTSPTPIAAPVPTHPPQSIYSPPDLPQGYSPPRPAHENEMMQPAVGPMVWPVQTESTERPVPVDLSQETGVQDEAQQWFIANSGMPIPGDDGLQNYQLPPSATSGTHVQAEFSSFANEAMGANMSHPHYGRSRRLL
ncbi:hypothetical protein FRC03_008739 [Tulasnella sp. 419]|nr:hypothetical protein FRC03_008739 [Tulasnella sp. 419]